MADDDGGIQWWNQLGAQELAEYEAWLDEQDKYLNQRKEHSAKHQSDDRIQVPETV